MCTLLDIRFDVDQPILTEICSLQCEFSNECQTDAYDNHMDDGEFIHAELEKIH